jgi:transcriptional regulator with XRE-family HTH domain
MIPEWAQHVAQLRQKLGLKQVEFAAYFGVSQAAISGWESGKKEPSVENFVRMGNIADDQDCLWFWEKAGVDLNRLRSCKLPTARD